MANRRRGEIEAHLDGRSYRLCLTLGALAELEAAFESQDLLGLAERFSSGRLAAADAVRILGAGLRGGGNDLTDETVAAMSCAGGAAGYVAIVAELLTATFGGAAPDPAAPGTASTARPTEDRPVPRPFPGAR
jgi:hypothetical protein